MTRDGVEVRAAGTDLLQFESVVLVEVVGVGKQTSGDRADLRRWRRGRQGGARGAQWAEVLEHGGPASGVALLADLPK